LKDPDYTIEDLDLEALPEKPLFVMMTMPAGVIQSVMPLLHKIKKKGVRVETSNR
jgi:hypothetical protein